MVLFRSNFGEVSKKLGCCLGQDDLGTLTDLSASRPRSLLKTTPPPLGCPWVLKGPEVAPESSFRGLMLDHQVLKQPEAKNLSKTAKFDQKQQFLSVFLDLASLKLDGRASNP